MDPGVTDTHACRRCGAPIANRYAFDDCTRCALDANARNPEVVAWRAAQIQASRERIAAMKAKKEAENQ